MSDPFEAREIAERSVYWLRLIREAKSVPELNEAWQGFKAYADQARVCSQIRSHLSNAYAEVKAGLVRNRVVRDPTGEQVA